MELLLTNVLHSGTRRKPEPCPARSRQKPTTRCGSSPGPSAPPALTAPEFATASQECGTFRERPELSALMARGITLQRLAWCSYIEPGNILSPCSRTVEACSLSGENDARTDAVFGSLRRYHSWLRSRRR